MSLLKTLKVATREFYITLITCIIFPLDSVGLAAFISDGDLNRNVSHAKIRSDSFLGQGRPLVPVWAILLGVVFSTIRLCPWTRSTGMT